MFERLFLFSGKDQTKGGNGIEIRIELKQNIIKRRQESQFLRKIGYDMPVLGLVVTSGIYLKIAIPCPQPQVHSFTRGMFEMLSFTHHKVHFLCWYVK